MFTDLIRMPAKPARPTHWVVFDLESAVLSDTAHKRYQAMERFTPGASKASRRGHKRGDNPLLTPRWPFQTITTASLMVLAQHPDGNLQVSSFTTLSAPELTEKEVIEGVLKVLADTPATAELVTWGGQMHDIPLLVAAAMRHGLTLPIHWRWLAFIGGNPPRHLDLCRAVTGGFKMKPVHMSEICAANDVPCKMSAPAFSVARLMKAGMWDVVKDACDGDVISTALLFARWKRLHDDRATTADVEDRLLRQIVELRPGRGYTADLEARRRRAFAKRCAGGFDAAAILAGHLTPLAA